MKGQVGIRNRVVDDDDDEILIDTTQALPLRSKKTGRQKRKQDRRSLKEAVKLHLLSLLPELLLEILFALRPSDVITFQQLCKATQSFVHQHESYIARVQASYRYPNLSRCFPRPVFLSDVDAAYHPALLSDHRQKQLALHRKPYLHIPPHDPSVLCSCLTCVIAWNNLCLIVDLAYWTKTAIAVRQPIPMMPRGQNPDWNVSLTSHHAAVVTRALRSPLRYVHVLERHLETTIFSIRRYTSRDGTPLYGLIEDDVRRGTDEFCARRGPPNYEFPLHRDAYYGLQTYLPNRGWKKGVGCWFYQPTDLHLSDLEMAKRMADATTKKKVEEENGGTKSEKDENSIAQQQPSHLQ
jgi:hypothetical protein